MHFVKSLTKKEELLCVRITIALRNVPVSELGWEKFPEGTGSMHLPSLGAIPDRFMGLEFIKHNSKVTSWPSFDYPPGLHECSELITNDSSGDQGL